MRTICIVYENYSEIKPHPHGDCFWDYRLGFALMIGEPSGATEYNPDIFSVRRITVGPMIALFGFVMMLVGILYRPKNKQS